MPSIIHPWGTSQAIMRKKGVLQLALQLTVYVTQLIATQLQLNQNNSFLITMQLYYNYTHDVMLTS
jgi:hypothetical protein